MFNSVLTLIFLLGSRMTACIFHNEKSFPSSNGSIRTDHRLNAVYMYLNLKKSLGLT